MQHGPETPPTTPQTVPETTSNTQAVPVDTAADTGTGDTVTAEVQNQNDTQDQAAILEQADVMDQTAQDSGSESFFETWAKGQEMPMGPSMLFVAGVVLAFIVIMRSLMRSSAKRKHQTRTMGDPTERIETLNQRAKGSMDPARKAMVDAEELTRRMGAVLDNKATKIEILLAEATERIAQLERANQEISRSVSHQAQNTAAEVPNSMNASRGVCPEALDRARLDQDRVERTWIDTDTQEKQEKASNKEPTFRIDRGFQPAPQQESPHPLTFPEQVDELATQGLNANEIANKLNRLVGEVELVLNLRRNSG